MSTAPDILIPAPRFVFVPPQVSPHERIAALIDAAQKATETACEALGEAHAQCHWESEPCRAAFDAAYDAQDRIEAAQAQWAQTFIEKVAA